MLNLRKKIAAISLTLAAFFCFSQTEFRESIFTLLPFGGFNACQIHGDNFSGYNKFGVNFGLQVNTKLGNKTSFNIGIGYSQKGTRKNQKPEDGDFTFYRVNLHYAEVPLLMEFKLNKLYYLTLGGNVGYLFHYTEDNEFGNWNGVYPFNDFEFSCTAGLGRKLKEPWLVEVRTTNSFWPIREYGIIANQVFFPNALARFFNKGLYNNILSVSLLYKIKPKLKTENPS